MNHIEVTNDKILLKDGTNLSSLMHIYNMFSQIGMGSPQFFSKIERLLAMDLKNKK